MIQQRLKPNNIVKYFFLALFTALFLLNREKAKAESTSNVNATVKLSVCGNGTAESGEDCDGADLKGKTCISLGYVSGTLVCDISCGYSTSSCAGPAATATPEPAATPTTATEPTLIPTIRPPAIIVPPLIDLFDRDNDGRIEQREVLGAVKTWVEEWKNALKTEREEKRDERRGYRECDLNKDNKCDLKDFSILLFHIEI